MIQQKKLELLKKKFNSIFIIKRIELNDIAGTKHKIKSENNINFLNFDSFSKSLLAKNNEDNDTINDNSKDKEAIPKLDTKDTIIVLENSKSKLKLYNPLSHIYLSNLQNHKFR